MPDPTTTNLIMAQPTRGSDIGTWDTPVNGNTGILDACAGSVTTLSLSNLNVTLTAQQAQVAVLRLVGTIVQHILITFPTPSINKSWLVENYALGQGPGSFHIALTAGGGGNVICVPQGSCQVYFDPPNFQYVSGLPPIGGLLTYATTRTPNWITSCSVPPLLLCDGSTFNAGTYPILFDYLNNSNVLPTFPNTVNLTFIRAI